VLVIVRWLLYFHSQGVAVADSRWSLLWRIAQDRGLQCRCQGVPDAMWCLGLERVVYMLSLVRRRFPDSYAFDCGAELAWLPVADQGSTPVQHTTVQLRCWCLEFVVALLVDVRRH